MPAGTYNFLAEQGATLQRTILYTDSNNVATDLTGYTAAMQVRPTVASSTVTLELTTENSRISLGGAAGTIDLLVDADDMAALTPGKYYYDLELYNSGTVIRLIEGTFTVKAEVTR
ncbi:MAG: hypothetical protein EBU46_18455 [Nitrosomonadaceae bacterium]|nr:hypothetical protein [Nitrosomonadaceae bacterium]